MTAADAQDGAPYVRIENLTKRFDGEVAVDNVSLDIAQGEVFTLLGGSGSGKTTLLRMIAGLEMPDEGRIWIDGRNMTGVPPYERPVNIMFQSYALFPHMTVERNIAFGLHQEGLPRREIASRVEEALRLVQLTRFAKRRPHQLSGGQRQRVALARCLVKRPKLLLLDEPLAALDKRLREQTQFELAAIQEKVGVTFIMVTHDQGEAMTMSSRLAVMREGRIEQVGTPAEIYEFPRTRFVADFIGTMNIFEGKVSRAAQGEAMVESAEAGATLRAEGGGAAAGATAFVAVRPEKIAIARAGDPAARADNVLEGVVEEIAYLGQSSTYVVALPSGKRVHVSAQNAVRRAELPISWDQRVVLTFPARAALVLAE